MAVMDGTLALIKPDAMARQAALVRNNGNTGLLLLCHEEG
jgi:hypothetical protein